MPLFLLSPLSPIVTTYVWQDGQLKYKPKGAGVVMEVAKNDANEARVNRLAQSYLDALKVPSPTN